MAIRFVRVQLLLILTLVTLVALAQQSEPASAASHTFDLTTLFEASEVPPTTDPARPTVFEQSSFAGDQVIALASESFGDLIGLFGKTPGESTVETIFDSAVLSPSTGNPVIGFVFPSGDESDILTSTGSRNDLESPVTEIAHHTGVPNAFSAVLSTEDQLPGSTANVDGLGLWRYSVSSDSLLYRAWLDRDLPTERTGLFVSPLDGSAATTLVDTTTVVPGTSGNSTFDDFFIDRDSFEDGTAVFLGEYSGTAGFGSGVYTVSAGSSPVPVVTVDDTLPSTVVSTGFSLFGAPAIDDGDIVFRASTFPEDALFAVIDGSITLIADTATQLPQSPSSTVNRFFLNSGLFPPYSIDSGRVLFGAEGSDGSRAVYLYDDGDISLVFTEGDQIDGLTSTLLNINSKSLRGNQIVMDMILLDENQNVESRVVLAEFETSTATADFNVDGSVNGADLAQWLGDYAINADSDADDDNDSDGSDFLAWQQQRSLPSLSAANALAVPEPGTLTLVSLALIVIATRPGTREARRTN